MLSQWFVVPLAQREKQIRMALRMCSAHAILGMLVVV